MWIVPFPLYIGVGDNYMGSLLRVVNLVFRKLSNTLFSGFGARYVTVLSLG